MGTVRLVALACCMSAIAGAAALAQDERAKAAELIRLVGSQQLAMQIMDVLLPQQLNLIGQANPNVDQQLLQRLETEIRSEAAASLDEFLGMVAEVYVSHFTSAELDELIAFYRTPMGQKVVRTMPVVMRESGEAGARWGRAVTVRVVERLKQAPE